MHPLKAPSPDGNRVKKVLPSVIDEEQSMFVQGRLITDNILVAMECFHWMKKKMKEKKILMNEKPSKTFNPERGLQQGDPISAYLFVICADVLSGLLKKEAVGGGSIHGTQVARRAPKISHLFFVDDSILFSRASVKEVEKLLEVLTTYLKASSQVVNLEKSEASFIRNMRDEVKQMIHNRMWNRDLVMQCFNRNEALQAISIPLSIRNPMDSLIWYRERNGEYSVKSAYHLIKGMEEAEGAGPLNRLKETIWKVRMLPRIKNFVWRLCKDILPTEANLLKKGSCFETLCPLCSEAPESSSHLFFLCPFAKRVWFAFPTNTRVPENVDVVSWMEECLGGKEVRVDQLLCICLWKIWGARNKRVFDGKDSDPYCVAQDVMDAAWECEVAETW
ncbi:unnamed protein product [Vicia faba]|uniref:Reverse transcriptase domain-containing protein n=1 Tax=Vicia faba TaxID=3906 RepID=A0AAV1A7Q2_VICFA|nr:unnamed protein product [Vicia faba]